MNRNTPKVRRQIRTRSKVQGTDKKPRLSVFRSNKYLYVQLVDDASGKTLLGLSEKVLTTVKGTGVEKAKQVGVALAKKAQEHKIKAVVFDKGSYAYHGRIKAVAEGAREGGLQF